jgi:hypothetical protein
MKTTKRNSVIAAALLLLLWTVQPASAFYSPSSQRWVTRDPIQERRGQNLYWFIGNMPLKAVDYLGLATICVDCNCKGVDLSGFSYVAESEPPNDGEKVFRGLPKPGECVDADGVYEPGRATKTGDLGSGTISCAGGKPKFIYHAASRMIPKNEHDGDVWPYGVPKPPEKFPSADLPPYKNKPPITPLPPLDPFPKPEPRPPSGSRPRE